MNCNATPRGVYAKTPLCGRCTRKPASPSGLPQVKTGTILHPLMDEIIVEHDPSTGRAMLETGTTICVAENTEQFIEFIDREIRDLLQPIETPHGVISPGQLVESITLQTENAAGEVVELHTIELENEFYNFHFAFDMGAADPDPEFASEDESPDWVDERRRVDQLAKLVSSMDFKSDRIQAASFNENKLDLLEGIFLVQRYDSLCASTSRSETQSEFVPVSISFFEDMKEDIASTEVQKKIIQGLVWLGAHEAAEKTVDINGMYIYPSHRGNDGIVLHESSEDYDFLSKSRDRNEITASNFTTVGYYPHKGEMNDAPALQAKIKFRDGTEVLENGITI